MRSSPIWPRPIAGSRQSASTIAGSNTRPRSLSASIENRRPRAVKHQRRVDEPHVPARVAAGKLEARRKQDAAPLVERVGQRGVGRLIGTCRGSRVTRMPPLVV